MVEERQEAEYMLVCASYEVQAPRSLDLLADYLDKYPDTPHANRIYALMASGYFFRYDYERALMLFGRSRLELLPDGERDDMTYRMATSYLRTCKTPPSGSKPCVTSATAMRTTAPTRWLTSATRKDVMTKRWKDSLLRATWRNTVHWHLII